MDKAYRIHINGIVQGVGFRPFVFRLAEELEIKGWVKNSSDGVDIHAEGSYVDTFYQRLVEDKPPLAFIISIKKQEVDIQSYSDFHIIQSKKTDTNDVLISPDVATCPDCWREMFEPTDRRYLYPFINCTNCGPRYTIIYDRPYDRFKTTMKEFAMCPDCQREYEDPKDRRFHAQPVACKKCGPTLKLFDDKGNELLEQGIGIRLLEEGAILAVKGLGGFHLVCDAYNENAVNRLRRTKERGSKPFALMARDLETAIREVDVTSVEKELLFGPSAPIVLLPKKNKSKSKIPLGVAPGLHTLGMMLPYTPIHHLLFQGSFDFLVMTSANLSGQPLIYENEGVFTGLRGIADYFLTHDRDIYHPCDDSVVQVIGGKATFIRRARGYVPLPLLLQEEVRDPIVGLGGEMKNAFCLAAGNMAFMSQYIGDMHGYENFERFKQEFDSYQKVVNVFPQKVAYDLHPEYATTKMAKAMDCPKHTVQHHHAHHVSVMAEYDLNEPMLGLICDGTGYGEDGKIWGFEYIYGNADGYTRVGHLDYLPLPGGDAGAKYPLRIAYAYLRTLLSEDEWSLTESLWQGLSLEEKNILEAQLKSRFQIFDTSSAGRLFDAVSGLLGVCTKVTYEGQAAIELESRAAVWLMNFNEPGQAGIPDILGNRIKAYRQEAVARLYKSLEISHLAKEPIDKGLKEISLSTKFRTETSSADSPHSLLSSMEIDDQPLRIGEGNSDREILLSHKIDAFNLSNLNNINSYLYSIQLELVSGVVRVKVHSLFRGIIHDLRNNVDTGEIAYKFHYSLACAMLETALMIGIGSKGMVISGGVFQNKLLTEILLDLAAEMGIMIYYPQKLPAGDGGLA